MPGFSDLKKGLSSIESLERELNLKQLQINRLLNITQAINNNVSAEGLFNMYRSFLSWEIGVKKMALFVQDEESGKWKCMASIGIEEEIPTAEVSKQFHKYTRLISVDEEEHPFIRRFDVVIPVRHKEKSIAYVFIGGFNEEDDMYNKVQFITTITNIVAVAIENKRLFKRQLEQERLKREMELAGEMQRMLIPKQLPYTSCYQLDSIYKPHYGVGGDYFDFMEFDNGRIIFCIGDISGKGVAAALLMANFQANFHTLIKKQADLGDFVRDLNHSVNLITKGERFITFFIAAYDMKTQTLSYVNAGHNPPVLVNDGQVQLLDRGCTILGSFPELPELEVGAVNLDGEAIILTFTDGLTDLQNEKEEYLNEQQLYSFVRSNYKLTATDFNQKLMGYLEAFKGENIYPDDFTVLTCKIFTPGHSQG
ncbi:MAG: GAF domain-containing SpoIIE family protein phosphatase [Phaeodactylibacter xiamenensis]|jgi:sigma-B regulation protein RsbU (phosphoserine phosphatase)|uniref:Serine/threonine protein phosphatase n=1 Tax=Phaeodactylibacter xiamenensis TaxID=1524460 RepID=A0A098S8K0_9BACT|nr:SpoIIE family protein phosphatase [Phaeodactylibacter xiamenensis]KGE88854.1 serine/threonine protein phosphatase [Phaeodactylibacter xiamenensis]